MCSDVQRVVLYKIYNLSIAHFATDLIYYLKMRIIKIAHLQAFAMEHADACAPLALWARDCRSATWKTPADVKAYARSADYVGNERWVFNIGGNKYRLVVAICFRTGIVLVKFVGTHAEYDKINAATVDDFGGAL